jgi:lipoate---protein ligase
MRLLELTLEGAAENVALDEALLEEAEATGSDVEILRLWEAPRPLVVIGRSSRIEGEVERAACAAEGVPVLRRSSGGAAIVAGPGCWMYAVVLSYARRPQLARLDEAHRTVLAPLAEALARRCPGVVWAGTSDLALDGRKFSGNSLRCKRTHLVYHGTLMYDFPLATIGRYLRTPPRQPEYREGRSHADFTRNLPLSRAAIRAAVLEAFPVAGALEHWPQARMEQLVREKYALASWNERL